MDRSDNVVDFSYEWVKKNLDEYQEYFNDENEKVIEGYYEGMKAYLWRIMMILSKRKNVKKR